MFLSDVEVSGEREHSVMEGGLPLVPLGKTAALTAMCPFRT